MNFDVLPDPKPPGRRNCRSGGKIFLGLLSMPASVPGLAAAC
jgi:hypothetical protein